MKFIAFLFAFATASSSLAMVNPFGHWTVKSYTCSSGAVPSPGFPADTRIDFHLYDDTKFEQIMLGPERWLVARGTYTNTDKRICFATTEYIIPKEPPMTMPPRPICWDFQLTAQEFVILSPSNSSCPQGDTLNINFELMSPL